MRKREVNYVNQKPRDRSKCYLSPGSVTRGSCAVGPRRKTLRATENKHFPGVEKDAPCNINGKCFHSG